LRMFCSGRGLILSIKNLFQSYPLRFLTVLMTAKYSSYSVIKVDRKRKQS
jgi:hypothetical protein